MLGNQHITPPWAQHQLTAVWLSLALILITQLNLLMFFLNMKSGPTPEALQTVQRTVVSKQGHSD